MKSWFHMMVEALHLEWESKPVIAALATVDSTPSSPRPSRRLSLFSVRGQCHLDNQRLAQRKECAHL
jgi:hypothetical protein